MKGMENNPIGKVKLVPISELPLRASYSQYDEHKDEKDFLVAKMKEYIRDGVSEDRWELPVKHFKKLQDEHVWSDEGERNPNNGSQPYRNISH